MQGGEHRQAVNATLLLRRTTRTQKVVKDVERPSRCPKGQRYLRFDARSSAIVVALPRLQTGTLYGELQSTTVASAPNAENPFQVQALTLVAFATIACPTLLLTEQKLHTEPKVSFTLVARTGNQPTALSESGHVGCTIVANARRRAKFASTPNMFTSRIGKVFQNSPRQHSSLRSTILKTLWHFARTIIGSLTTTI